jgi:hypothetical protein
MKNTPTKILSYNAIQVRKMIEQNQRSTEFLNLTDTLMEKPEHIAGLVDLVVSDDIYPYPQYASHLLLHVSWKNHLLLEPHYNMLIDCILITKNTSIMRNILGVVISFQINEYKEGELLDWLFANINNVDSKPGLLNYSVRKLAQYIKLYPELRNEVEMAIELREELSLSTGLVAWSRTVLNKPY